MRQRKSSIVAVMDASIFKPTKRSRNKPKPIPTESQVQTFDYVYSLLRAKWDRMRRTRA
ncbi:NinE family protein [Buttiauxella sp. 3AFRM03]|uniref:NinE family protein n=1 Tax=Buttiauxella sp. 3AFRM03 TaxID=2479367 RepID=UPI000EF7CA7B|nr:NinE family protein [Buttiauxella sp. 3AFRM03]